MSVKSFGLSLVLLLVWSSPSLAAIKEKVVVAANGQKIPVVDVFPDKVDGKIPAMLVMHGSGGPAKREYDYAERFAKMGVAAIVIDSFSPRGIKDVITNQEAVRSSEMALDAIAVLQEAAKHPKLDSSRIGIIGFSKGGAVALRTPLDFVNKAGNAQFALHIAMYPNCDSFRLKVTTPANRSKFWLARRMLMSAHRPASTWRLSTRKTVRISTSPCFQAPNMDGMSWAHGIGQDPDRIIASAGSLKFHRAFGWSENPASRSRMKRALLRGARKRSRSA